MPRLLFFSVSLFLPIILSFGPLFVHKCPVTTREKRQRDAAAETAAAATAATTTTGAISDVKRTAGQGRLL